MSLLAIAPEISTQTPGVLAPQKYKSWLMIDSKNSNVTEIVSQLGIARALFSAGETRAKKSRGGAGNFYLVGHNWENVYLGYWRDSTNDECRRYEKLGGPGACSPGKFWKFKYTRMQPSAIWTLEFGKQQDFIAVNKVRKYEH